MTSKIIQVAREYALKRHFDTGCTYDGQTYGVHLTMAVEVAEKYIMQSQELLAPEFQLDIDVVLSALWCHDVIEDTRATYNDVLQLFLQTGLFEGTAVLIADTIYNVTNELGKNRKQRALKTYPKIAGDKYATFVKGCDRIANTTYSRDSGSGMYPKYVQEYPEFRRQLKLNDGTQGFHPLTTMWKDMDILNMYEV